MVKLLSKAFPILIGLVLILGGCSGEKEVKPDTPGNTSWLMKLSIDADNYESFNQLFSEGRRDTVTKEIFDSLKNLTTAGSDYKLYELVTFQNGKMLLVLLTPEKIDGKYYIQDVIEVPEDMKGFFDK